MELDPWHLITSFVQYMFKVPSCINVLNVYMVCDLILFNFLECDFFRIVCKCPLYFVSYQRRQHRLSWHRARKNSFEAAAAR